MKNLWKSLDSKWQWILKIASILAVLTGGGFTVNGFIDFSRDIRNAPDDIEELYVSIEHLEREVAFLNKCNEMIWEMLRENTTDLDTVDRYIVFDDGAKWEVDIRMSHLGNPISFIFNYTIFPARWSDTNVKYYVVGPDGKSVLIYIGNGN